ncbi:MAG: TIGR00300 family protein, partial [Nocardioides sp.]
MSVSETVEVAGHLMDSGILGIILADVREYGGDYVFDKFEVGHDAHHSSRATITVTAEDDEALQRLLMRLQTRGVNQVDPGEAVVTTADVDGVFPDGFYSTTNLPTKVRLDGRWYDVANPEMDCGLVVETGGADSVRIVTLP